MVREQNKGTWEHLKLRNFSETWKFHESNFLSSCCSISWRALLLLKGPPGFALFVFMSRIENVRWVSSIGGIILRGKNWREICDGICLCIKHLTWTGLSLKPGLRFPRRTTDRLSPWHGLFLYIIYTLIPYAVFQGASEFSKKMPLQCKNSNIIPEVLNLTSYCNLSLTLKRILFIQMCN